MNDTSGFLLAELEELFHQTGQAHHQAFIDTDGEDLEWPVWYAENMIGRLSVLLEAKFTQSELIYLLVGAEKERSLRAPGADWARYYARFFAERYT
jgi:hypothetical protein